MLLQLGLAIRVTIPELLALRYVMILLQCSVPWTVIGPTTIQNIDGHSMDTKVEALEILNALQAMGCHFVYISAPFRDRHARRR
jgi:hypothetical protein